MLLWSSCCAFISTSHEPALEGRDAFAVIDIFSRTDRLTPDASDRVPVAYRFLSGDALTARTYTVGLPARATRWTYVVVVQW